MGRSREKVSKQQSVIEYNLRQFSSNVRENIEWFFEVLHSENLITNPTNKAPGMIDEPRLIRCVPYSISSMLFKWNI